MSFSYNAAGVKMDKGFQPAPEGFYKLKIESASDQKEGQPRVTKNGDPYVNVQCVIVGGEYEGKKVFHNVTFLAPDKKGAGMALNFLKNIGQPYEGDFDVEPEKWVGSSFDAKLRVSTGQDGKPRNEIAWIIDTPESAEVPF